MLVGVCPVIAKNRFFIECRPEGKGRDRFDFHEDISLQLVAMAQVVGILGVEYGIADILILRGIAKLTIEHGRDQGRRTIRVFGDRCGRHILRGLIGKGGGGTDLQEGGGIELVVQPDGITGIVIKDDDAVIGLIACAEGIFVLAAAAGDRQIMILIKRIPQHLVVPIGGISRRRDREA